MNINIVLPYENGAARYKIWANEEKSIDFRKEPERAQRCTVCFAATELEQYLGKLGFGVTVGRSAKEEFQIALQVDGEMCQGESGDLTGQEFTFQKLGNTLVIRGSGRAGVLYGVYEFLQVQGVYWLNPWEEVLPAGEAETADRIILPTERFYQPAFPMGRGFEFEGPLKDSEKLYLWMARNKLNLSTYRHQTAALQKKLGMIFKQGGHIFEKILDPDNSLPSGKTIWEEHPEWYGLPKSGVRRKDEVLYTQFCMSNEELLEYLCGELLQRLQKEWYHVDRIDVWGFDTWGSCCQCENCKALGNASDQTLHFMSYLRSYLDKAREDGRLDRKVNLVFGAYEGTSNLKAPVNPIPENIRNSGDYISYAPIVRCFEHCFDDDQCACNKYYNRHLTTWCSIPGGVSMGINEYYNVSKFEDIPFLFTNTMVNDIRHYHRLGVKCMTYMHLPMIHWGMRNLTQMLYARLCWDANVDAQALIAGYFKARYGSHAESMKIAYRYMEEAGKNCSSWRAWTMKSILSHLQNWDGAKPDAPLFRDDHLEKDTVGAGVAAASCYEEAVKILEKELCMADDRYVKNLNCVAGVALNPTDKRFKLPANAYGDRIREDLIYARYGKDCMELITLFVAYYEALEKNSGAEELFERIEALAGKMQSYYIPIRYDNPEAEIHCDTALKRSQLDEIYYRCKSVRINRRGVEE